MEFWQILIDIIDIAIVAFVIYQLLLILRGRRAMQMLVALFIIFVIGFVAQWLEFDALNWLMSGLKGVWAIIFVVLFQDELRRLLGQLGQSRFLRPFFRTEEHEVIDAVISSVQAMSGKKTGALIVLERSAKLINYYQTGVTLNAPVVPSLLVSIFTPLTPLHDGAVIINGDQIVAARCTLPLSQNPYFVHTLGTRHRAAVGLTEETDAVVVVVSEETGELSLALAGQISRGLSVNALRERLTQLLRPPSSESGGT
ncbi:MAG: TIGR00159 family protein [Candidatus Eisenbacteria bacterium]|nr:TIGR00159 family protein [Candidatus Eisenbacteria bacterium]